MTDGNGRSIDYLRISLTDKCNLRCGYCMPAEGIRHLSHGDILSLEEIQRTVSIMTELGVRKVRLTGGEPLVRKGVTDLIKMLDTGFLRIVMTTNGIRLKDMANDLKEAGLAEVNISLDTMKRDTFIKLSGSDELEGVIAGIRSASLAGLKVKLNCVPIRGMNDDETEALISFAEETGSDIRFIELMPIGCGVHFQGIPSDEIISKLEMKYGDHLEDTGGSGYPDTGKEVKGPARYYSFNGLNIRVGFISPLSHGFCENCNRIRLTAEGFLKLCLQYPYGIDLRALLRSGASDDEIKEEICRAIKKKPSSHSFGHASPEDVRKMIQIGG